jgi:MFS family permease
MSKRGKVVQAFPFFGAQKEASRKDPHYGWMVALMGLLITIGCHGFARFAYTMILPSMKRGLDLTYTQMGLLGTGNLIGYVLSAVIGGFLAAKYGSRIIITLSMLLTGTTMILTGFSQYFEHALVMRVLTGIGNGGAYVPTMALGSAWFAARRRGLGTGIIAAGIGIGTFISGLWVPHIILSHGLDGWRYCWYYLGTTVFVITMMGFLFIRDRPEDKDLTPIGVEAAPKKSYGSPTSGGSSLGWSLVYKNKKVWYLGLVYFMFGLSYVIYATFFFAYLREEMGLKPIVAGGLWALIGGLSIVSGPIGGHISDRVGRRYGSALLYLMLMISFSIFAGLKSMPGFYMSAVIFGTFAWSIPTVTAATAGDFVGPRLASAGIGFITLLFGIGQAIGPTVGGIVADITGSFTMAFALSAIAAAVGAGGSLLLKTSGS